MNKKKLLLGLVVVVAVVLVFLNSQQNRPASGEPIKIGAVLSLTGFGSFWAEFSKNAALLAVDEINGAGGVNGRPLQIIFEDSQTVPAKGVSSFQKLTSIDGTKIVIGDVWAFLANPLVALSESTKTLVISPTVMNNSVEGESEYFFTLGHTTESITEPVATFFKQYPDSKTVGILCWSANTWGLAFTETYERLAKENGKEIVVKTCTNDFATDYRIESAKIKDAKPDLVLVVGFSDRIVKTLKDFGVTAPILADSNLIDGFENSKSLSVEKLKDVYVIDWQANQDFIKKYQDKYGRYPILEAQNSYETIRSIAKALENDFDNPVQGLKKVKYESVDGLIDFTEGSNINPNKANAKLFKILGYGQYQEVK